jgi:hypothetical protein
MKSDRQLKYWFNKYNALYFASELPGDTCVWWEPTNASYADCGLIDGHWRIRVNPSLTAWVSLWKLTLLHEMCHIKLHPNRNHGRKFQQEMLRLAAMGAFAELW